MSDLFSISLNQTKIILVIKTASLRPRLYQHSEIDAKKQSENRLRQERRTIQNFRIKINDIEVTTHRI